jgi:hypothetical protein
MSNSYAGRFTTRISSKLSEIGEMSTATDAIAAGAYSVDYTITNGAAANGAQVHWHDRATMTASATADINLCSLAHAFGTVSMSVVKAAIVRVTSTATGVELTVGAPTSNTFAAVKGTVGPSGMLMGTNFTDGWAVTTETNDLIGLENTGTGTLAYEIIIVGNGAVS